MKFELIPDIGCIGCVGLLYDNDEDDEPELLIANIFWEDLEDLKVCVETFLKQRKNIDKSTAG